MKYASPAFDGFPVKVRHQLKKTKCTTKSTQAVINTVLLTARLLVVSANGDIAIAIMRRMFSPLNKDLSSMLLATTKFVSIIMLKRTQICLRLRSK